MDPVKTETKLLPRVDNLEVTVDRSKMDKEHVPDLIDRAKNESNQFIRKEEKKEKKSLDFTSESTVDMECQCRVADQTKDSEQPDKQNDQESFEEDLRNMMTRERSQNKR